LGLTRRKIIRLGKTIKEKNSQIQDNIESNNRMIELINTPEINQKLSFTTLQQKHCRQRNKFLLNLYQLFCSAVVIQPRYPYFYQPSVQLFPVTLVPESFCGSDPLVQPLPCGSVTTPPVQLWACCTFFLSPSVQLFKICSSFSTAPSVQLRLLKFLCSAPSVQLLTFTSALICCSLQYRLQYAKG
jgi:hypothetical protein